VPQSSTARISQSSAHAARLSARQRSVQLFAREFTRLVMLFAPVSLRSGSAALWASVSNHRRELLWPQTVISGSRLSAPTNPRNSPTSPGFGWSHNSSFKPIPCRGIGHVLYATLAHVRRPATGRLNSGVMRGVAVDLVGSRWLQFDQSSRSSAVKHSSH
jgi:hypothetical protein